MSYIVHASGYLARARARLNERTQEGLFYATLELRSGIESRMHEYLEAREDIANRKKHGYQVAKLAKGLERVFAAGEKVVRLRGIDEYGRPMWEVYFTPVRARLRKHAARLGDYLHGNQLQRPDDDPWWTEFRSFLNEVVEELDFACSGTLMGPPLLEKKTNRMSIVVQVDHTDPIGAQLTRKGDSVVLQVEYLDDYSPAATAA